MNKDKIEYRIIPDSLGILRRLQFKSYIKIFGCKITVWRYIPNSYVANVFKESDCPWILPLTSSHCYIQSNNDKQLIDFCMIYSYSLVEHFAKLERDKESRFKIVFIP